MLNISLEKTLNTPAPTPAPGQAQPSSAEDLSGSQGTILGRTGCKFLFSEYQDNDSSFAMQVSRINCEPLCALY